MNLYPGWNFLNLKTTWVMINLSFNSFLKTLSRYPKLHSLFSKTWDCCVSKFIPETVWTTLFASTQYAQIFWTTVAQILLGIYAKFSTHTKLFSAHRNTKLCRFSQAHTLIKTSSSLSDKISFPKIFIFITKPSKSFTKIVFAPEPKKYFLFCK